MHKILDTITRGRMLTVTVRSRKKTHFEGTAAALSSKNTRGPFDVLPRHIHFISLIQDGITVRTREGGDKHIQFPRGVMKVKDDKVEIYIGTEEKK